MENEKRAAQRAKASLFISYSSDNIKWDLTQIKNISVKGIRINTIKPFAKEEILYLRFALPIRPFEKLDLKGAVIESRELKSILDGSVAGTFITHVQFVDLNQEQSELINEYVKWFLSKKGGSV